MARAAANNGNGESKEVIRISISIDQSLRRNMRIAAAHADMEVGEWAKDILTHYAEKAVQK